MMMQMFGPPNLDKIYILDLGVFLRSENQAKSNGCTGDIGLPKP